VRALIATLLCLAVLAGAIVAVARYADNTAATMRTNAARALITGGNCGCTADIRAKDRIANRDTANDAGSK
jgi:hypothetical protein